MIVCCCGIDCILKVPGLVVYVPVLSVELTKFGNFGAKKIGQIFIKFFFLKLFFQVARVFFLGKMQTSFPLDHYRRNAGTPSKTSPFPLQKYMKKISFWGCVGISTIVVQLRWGLHFAKKKTQATWKFFSKFVRFLAPKLPNLINSTLKIGAYTTKPGTFNSHFQKQLSLLGIFFIAP